MNKNVVQLRNGFVNLTNNGENNYQLAMSVASELMQFGFVLNQSAIDNLTAASREDVVEFHDEVIYYLKKATGSDRNYTAFWKGFPEQVMEKSECELWLHQIVHYISNGTYEPSEWTKERPTAFEQANYTKITAGDENRFLKIFTDLTSVNQSLTPDDLEIIKWFVSSGQKLVYPSSIPFKENLCTLAAMGLDVPVKTVTDVLRIAVGMSGGDISLPKVPWKNVKLNRWSSELSDNPERENFKFKKFKRSERRQILSLLEKTNCDASEACLKAQRWVRLGEILHPGEYKNKFPRAFKMFNEIRNEKVRSWYSKLNQSFEKSFEAGIKVLSERPGEFMRRLDWIIRSNGKDRRDFILDVLADIAPRVSNKVLFEAYAHFGKRLKPVTGRTIMVKGARSRTELPDLPAIPQKVVDQIREVIISSLKSKFSTLDKLGNVYLDEELKKIPLPTNMRSSSSSLKPIVRGTRTPVGNAKVIRAFVHWFDENGREDLDLTATFVGMGKSTHIGWNGTHNSQKLGCYSGDIRHRQGPCAEYIDIKVDSALKEGYKYVILDVRNYNGGSFKSLRDCVAGYMERENAKANEIFVPKTISNCTRLENDSSTTLMSIIDLETREVIHLDIDQDGIPVASANFEQILEAIKPYCELPEFSVHHLLELHVETRGNIVDNEEDADLALKFDDFSESYVETLKYIEA